MCSEMECHKERPEVIAIIPARGGSKGIPSKNIANLAGKPLVAYSIQAARNARLIDRVIVSTDDENIAQVSKEWGAEVPFLRPKKLSGDSSDVWEAITYTITHLEDSERSRAYVELYPTSPFRTAAFVDEMVTLLLKGYSSVITVKQIQLEPRMMFTRDRSENKLKNIFGPQGGIPAWKKYYKKYPIFFGHWEQEQGKERHYYHVLTDPCMLIDIDMPRDLRWAEAVIQKGLFQFDF